MRRIQLELFYWFNAKRQALVPTPVEFSKLIHELHIATFTPPTLPASLSALASNPNSGSLATPIDLSELLTAAHSSAVSTSDMSSITDFFTTFQQQQQQPKPANKGSGDAISNPHPDHDLDKALDGNKIRIVCKPPFPQNSAKQEMCIPYHAKGRCFALCGRATDHMPPSDHEKAILHSYVEAQVLQYRQGLAKKRAGTSIPP